VSELLQSRAGIDRIIGDLDLRCDWTLAGLTLRSVFLARSFGRADLDHILSGWFPRRA
jgi:hypothetical protein